MAPAEDAKFLLIPVKKSSDDKTEKKISTPQAICMLLCITVGTVMIVTPYVVVQAGLAGSILIYIVAVVLVFTGGYLNTICCRKLDIDETEERLRDPFPRLAELAAGQPGRIATVIIYVLCCILVTISLLMVTASTMQSLIPLPHLTQDNQNRIWLLILSVTLSPIVLLSNLAENVYTAFLGFALAMLALLVIQIESIITLYKSCLPLLPETSVTFSTFTAAAGTLFFTLTGPAVILPNLAAEIWNVDDLGVTLIVSSCIYDILSGVAMFVPWIVFGSLVQPNIFHTLSDYIERPSVLVVVLAIAQIAIVVHLMAAAVLYMNPVFQILEKQLNIPAEWSWKRPCLRLPMLLLIAALGISIPSMDIALSLGGGVTLNLLSITLPILFYYRFFPTTWTEKAGLALLFLFSLGFVFITVYNAVISIARA